MKEQVKGKHYDSVKEVKTEVMEWLKNSQWGRWNIAIEKNVDNVEN